MRGFPSPRALGGEGERTLWAVGLGRARSPDAPFIISCRSKSPQEVNAALIQINDTTRLMSLNARQEAVGPNSAGESVRAMSEIYQLIFESSPMGILVADENGKIILANLQLCEMFGYARGQLIGRPVEDLMPLRFRRRHRSLRASFRLNPSKRTPGTRKEFTGLRGDGHEFPVEIGLNCVQDSNRTMAMAVVVEISERKQVEDRLEFLAREVRHRAQNLFTVIEVIASRTFSDEQPVQQAKVTFLGRLRALSKAYTVLSDSGFQRAQLAGILRQEIDAFSNRIAIRGCDVAVSASAAQQFGIIVHELATNSLKYGALSSPDGHVCIDAKLKNEDGENLFSFHWVESDGPPVFKPEREGFGTMLLLDPCGQFCRHATLDYRPEGLHYSLDVPMEAIAAGPTPHG